MLSLFLCDAFACIPYKIQHTLSLWWLHTKHFNSSEEWHSINSKLLCTSFMNKYFMKLQKCRNRIPVILIRTSCQPWFMNKQIAGLPTNVGFLQELASHSAFEKGIVDTHFIERYKDDLLSTSTKASGESHGVAELGAILAAACICKDTLHLKNQYVC